jgi:hypothetical protein
MDDAGPKNFGLNWGLAVFLNALGILAFGQLFDWIYGKQGDGSDKCSGQKCLTVQFVIFGIFCLLATILAFYAYTKDDPTGQEPKRQATKSSRDRGHSKDRQSKGEKSKRKDKSETKTKDTDKKAKSSDKNAKSTDKNAKSPEKKSDRSASKKKK